MILLNIGKRLKKPLSKKAAEICLEILKENESDQREIVDNTIMNGWPVCWSVCFYRWLISIVIYYSCYAISVGRFDG